MSQRQELELSPLYAVADATLCRAHGWDVVAFGRELFAAGVRLVQLRAKDAPGAEALPWCDALAETARAHYGVLIVNDRADWCLMSGATGVHVGQEDVPVAACRRLLGEAAIIGLSTHTRSQVDAALAQPISYVAVGPVFATSTKATGYDPVGLDLVRYAAACAGAVPVVAIGGITSGNARSVLDAGATSVVVISDLLAGGNPGRRANQLLEALGPAG